MFSCSILQLSQNTAVFVHVILQLEAEMGGFMQISSFPLQIPNIIATI